MYSRGMSRPRAWLLVLVPLAGIAQAASGVRLNTESTDLRTGGITKMEMLLDQTRLRMNISGARGQTSLLFLTDGGRDRMVVLDRARNEYTEFDAAAMEQMAGQMSSAMDMMQKQMAKMTPEQRAQMEKMMKGMGMPGGLPKAGGGAPAAPVKTVFTAKGAGSANGYACMKYEGSREGQKVSELCAAKPAALKFALSDFAVFERMKAFSEKLQTAAAKSPFGGMLAGAPSLTEPGFDGFPVTQTRFTASQAVEKTDLKSVEKASFGDADFSLGGATKRDLPMARRPQ